MFKFFKVFFKNKKWVIFRLLKPWWQNVVVATSWDGLGGGGWSFLHLSKILEVFAMSKLMCLQLISFLKEELKTLNCSIYNNICITFPSFQPFLFLVVHASLMCPKLFVQGVGFNCFWYVHFPFCLPFTTTVAHFFMANNQKPIHKTCNPRKEEPWTCLVYPMIYFLSKPSKRKRQTMNVFRKKL